MPIYACPTPACTFETQDGAQMLYHMTGHGKLCRCSMCNEDFHNAFSLQQHQLTHFVKAEVPKSVVSFEAMPAFMAAPPPPPQSTYSATPPPLPKAIQAFAVPPPLPKKAPKRKAAVRLTVSAKRHVSGKCVPGERCTANVADVDKFRHDLEVHGFHRDKDGVAHPAYGCAHPGCKEAFFTAGDLHEHFKGH